MVEDQVQGDPRFVPGEVESATKRLHTRCIYALDWSHCHHRVVTGGADDTLRVFVLANEDVAGGELKLEASLPHAHELDVNGVAWSPATAENGTLLATCGDDERVKIWRYSPTRELGAR